MRDHPAANFDANGSPLDEGKEIIRASGDCLCDLCKRPYYRHPHTFEHLDRDNKPFLRVRCDGALIKL